MELMKFKSYISNHHIGRIFDIFGEDKLVNKPFTDLAKIKNRKS